MNGDCAGGGVELLLSTDIRIASRTARFGLPEVKWSIYPFGGATVKLASQIGHVHAMDLILTGRLIDAEFARQINLVNRVEAPDDVLPAAIVTAAAIAANSPVAVQAVKRQISDAIAAEVRDREVMEQQLGDEVRASPTLPRVSPRSAKNAVPTMAEALDIAGLMRPGDRLAWPGGSTEPSGLLAILEPQLDRVPADVSTFLNFSLIDAIDAARLASTMRIRTLGGAVTNRRFRDAGNLEIVPINYSTLPGLVASGDVRFDGPRRCRLR